MRITRRQLKMLIENYLLEQDDSGAPPGAEEDAPEEEEAGDESEAPPEAEDEDEGGEEEEEEPEEEEPEEPEFEEFETKEFPVMIGKKKLFARVIDKGIDGVKIYDANTQNRIENLKPLDISAIMFKTMVELVQKKGEKEDIKNMIQFFKYSQPDLESLSDEEIEKNIAGKERIWKLALTKLTDKLNQENLLK